MEQRLGKYLAVLDKDYMVDYRNMVDYLNLVDYLNMAAWPNMEHYLIKLAT